MGEKCPNFLNHSSFLSLKTVLNDCYSKRSAKNNPLRIVYFCKFGHLGGNIARIFNFVNSERESGLLYSIFHICQLYIYLLIGIITKRIALVIYYSIAKYTFRFYFDLCLLIYKSKTYPKFLNLLNKWAGL